MNTADTRDALFRRDLFKTKLISLPIRMLQKIAWIAWFCLANSIQRLQSDIQHSTARHGTAQHSTQHSTNVKSLSSQELQHEHHAGLLNWALRPALHERH